MIKSFSFLFFTVFALALQPVHAAVIFSDNFSSGDFNSWDDVDNPGAGNIFLDVLTDTGNVFGEGTSNEFAQFFDNNSGDSTFLGEGGALTNVATYQFDFYDTGTSKGVFFRMDQTTSGSSSDDYVQVGVQEESFNIRSGGANATYGSYSRDTEYRLTIIANNSGSTLTDYFGTEDLVDNNYAVWLTPVGGASTLIKGDAVFNVTNNNGDFTSIAAQTFSGATGVDFYVDNVEAFSGVETSGLSVVPEPSSFALLLGSLSLLLVTRRRR